MSDLAVIHNQLHRSAPSIFAAQPYEALSDKYRFIPTINVVDALIAQGFTPFSAAENRVRKPGKKGYSRHLIRLRHSDTLGQVGDFVPEILLANSHDGSSSFQISAGVYRMVCSNGMVVGNDLLSESIRHSGKAGDIIDGVFRIVDDFPKVIDTVQSWQGIELDRDRQIEFARQAAKLRWDTDREDHRDPVEPTRLLSPRRTADVGKDLWRTFNVVQEHMIKGGVPALGSSGRRARSRAVGSVSEDLRINKGLWALAEEFAAAA